MGSDELRVLPQQLLDPVHDPALDPRHVGHHHSRAEKVLVLLHPVRENPRIQRRDNRVRLADQLLCFSRRSLGNDFFPQGIGDGLLIPVHSHHMEPQP